MDAADATVLMVLASREASETFVAREIDALQKRGYPLVVACLTERRHSCLRRGALTERRHSCLRRLAIPFCNFLRGVADKNVYAPLLRRIIEELLSFSPRNALRIWRHRHAIAALVEKAREVGAARLHAQFAWIATDVTGIAAQILNLPWACSVHAWDVFTRPASELRRRLRGAEFVIACNERARDVVASAVTCHVHLVRHGLKWREHPAPMPTSKQDMIVSIGRLVPKKGFDTLLVAMSRLCHKHARLVLIGDGPERGRLQRLATKLNLARRVEFLGSLPHGAAMRELSRAALLALPSRRTRGNDSDGFANVLTEAMLHGAPIVTTTAAGAGELLADNESALLVPPDDPARLAAAMDRLFADPALQKRLADNARRVLETHLDEDVEIAKTAALIFPFCKPGMIEIC